MFSSKSPKKSSKKMFPFNDQLPVNNSSFFDRKVGYCHVRVFPLLWATLASFVESITSSGVTNKLLIDSGFVRFR